MAEGRPCAKKSTDGCLTKCPIPACRPRLHPHAGITDIAVRTAQVARAATALRTIPIFAELGETQLHMLAASGRPLRLARYAQLYRRPSRWLCPSL